MRHVRVSWDELWGSVGVLWVVCGLVLFVLLKTAVLRD